MGLLTTHRLILFSGVFAVAIASASCAARAAERPHCVYPDPYALLGRAAAHLETVDYLLFDTKAGPMRWLFLSWESPHDGMTFLLSCDGHVVARRRVGYVTSQGWGLASLAGNTGPGTSVDITTASMTSAGVLLQTESWLQFDGKAINVLWTHDNLVTRVEPKPDSTTETYQSTFFPSRNEILVTGKRRKALGDDASSVALPAEKYCFRSDLHRYVRC